MNLMNLKSIFLLAIVSVAFCAGLASTASAQAPRLYVTNRQLQTLLNRIETRTDMFQAEVQRSFANSNNVSDNREDRIENLISEFENATDTLKVRVNSRQTLTGEVNEVFNRANRINSFVQRSRLNSVATSHWSAIRTDLNTLATYYRISWNWNETPVATEVGTGPRLYATNRQLQTLVNRIQTGTNAFQAEVLRSFAANNDNVSESREDRIENLISEFENATDTLRIQANSQQSLTGEVNEVFNRAARINTFVSNNRLNRRATSQWSTIRTDLDTLATYYRISWNWNQTPPSGSNGGWNNNSASIEGTYRLNVGRSDNVATVIDASLRNSTASQRETGRRSLERRLASPEMVAIDVEGTNVTLATSNSKRVTFDANGVASRETSSRGRTLTTTATLNRRGLEVNYVGDRTNDFMVSFSPSGRDQLTVTKRVYLEGRNEMVTVNSVYDRTSPTADWTAVGAVENWNDNTAVNDFFIPNGTRITAELQGTVNTRASQVGDKVTMVVTSPSQYRDAIIEGRIVEAERSGRFSGRANISIGFDSIRMNGRTYQFAGIIDAVRAANGDTVSVNNEGVIRDRSQTTQTATRAGIGAILGGIIGAIAGGGSGAAIGAGVGAGAGAGTVLISGRSSIELGNGSTFDITASAPANTRAGRN
jgi:hypothetical protein